MHIEPGIVSGAKVLLSYGTAMAALGVMATHVLASVRQDGAISVLVRSLITTLLVLCFFEIFPHQAVGVSEVHLILGSTLLLVFGLAPAAAGLAGGLLVQGLLFAPFDLPQYGINLTTLLAPLYATHWLARQIIPANTAYVDLSYSQVLRLSALYQGGIVSWVAFWAFYGQGFTADSMLQVATFGAAYMSVVLVEPLIDLAVLAGAKSLRQLRGTLFVERRLYVAA